MLAYDGKLRKQTIQDDMESLFYVVLYCSFLWLPHKLSKEDLHRTIKKFFEAASWVWPYADFEGGEGKVANAMRREYTKDVEFNPALKEWLDTVMDYNNPPPHLRQAYREAGKWSDPEQLDNFWGEFLRTHTLERDDRVVHDHPHATGKYGAHPEGRYSTEAISLGGKRASQRRGLEEQPAVKRCRVTAPPVALAQTQPRRSDRLRKPPSHAPPVVPRARKVTPSAARTPTL